MAGGVVCAGPPLVKVEEQVELSFGPPIAFLLFYGRCACKGCWWKYIALPAIGYRLCWGEDYSPAYTVLMRDWEKRNGQ